MTPSDRDPNTPGAANPFDTGLPMLRMPPPAKSKRKRIRQAGRVIGRNADAARSAGAEATAARRGRPAGAPPDPGVIDSGTAGEPIPPLPVPERTRPSGDWAQWLEPRPAPGRSASPPSERAPVSGQTMAAPDDRADDDRYSDRYRDDQHGEDRYRDDRYSDDRYSDGQRGDDQYGHDGYRDDQHGDDRNLDDGDRDDRPGDDRPGDDQPGDDQPGDDGYRKRAEERRNAYAANAFGDHDPDEPRRLPSLVDRTGGNPGPSLRRPRPRGGDSESRNDRMLAVLVVVGVLIAVGSIVWAVLPSSPPERQAEPPPVEQGVVTPAPTTIAPEVAAVATPGCEQRNSAEIVSGTHPGGTTDGPSAILAFEHAYYVLRSGAAARSVVAPDSAVPAADQIQRGIDQVPVGTRYCVHITKVKAPSPDGLTRWEVRLTQQYPEEQAKTFLQSIATRSHTGKTLIDSISMA